MVVSSTTGSRMPVTASALLRLLLLLLLGLLRLRSQRAGCCVLLFCLSPLPPFLPSSLLSLSSAGLWVSSTLSSSQACSDALLAGRHIRRRPRIVSLQMWSVCPHGSTKRFSTMPCALSAHKLSRFRNLIERFLDSCIEYASSSCPLWPSPRSRALFSSPQFSPLPFAFLAHSEHSLLLLSSLSRSS